MLHWTPVIESSWEEREPGDTRWSGTGLKAVWVAVWTIGGRRGFEAVGVCCGGRYFGRRRRLLVMDGRLIRYGSRNRK